MKQLIPAFTFVMAGLSANAQFSVSAPADSVQQVPSPACMSCSGNDWMNMENAGAIDASQAYTVLYPNPNCFQTNCYYTRHLYTHRYGFTIPANAVILGIEVTISRMSGNTNSATDSTLRLVKTAPVPIGQNKALATPWVLGASTQVYGGPTDLWGTTWSPAEINDPQFGVWYNIFNSGTNTTTPGLDGIEVEVYYAITPGVIESQSTAYFGKMIWNGSAFQAVFNSGIQNAQVEIFDVAGKKVAGGSEIENGQTLTAKKPESGLYIYKITSNGRIQSGKMYVPFE